MVFWLLAILLLLGVLLVLAWPLLRPAPDAPVADDYSLNLSVYKDQLSELSEEQEEGVLTVEQARAVRREIEHSLLEEVPEEAVEPAPSAASGRAARWPVAVVAVLVAAVSVSLYLYLGSPGVTGPGGGMPGSVNEMVQRLETRLQNNPDDIDGWFMLGRSYMVLGRYDEAVQVMQRLHEQLGNVPAVLIRYAHALAMSNGGSFQGRPELLIKQVLKDDPGNPSALWFAGVAADERGDYQVAIDHWQRLLPLLRGEDEARQKLQNLIAQARASLGGGAAPAAGREKAAGSEGGGPAIKVHVSLSESLRDKVDPDTTLFIFARAPTGLPMPLAVIKRRAGDLPLDVVLDDSLAMSPQHMISGQDKVDLVARLSRSGSPRGQSGDIQGEKQGVAVDGADTVSLVIDSEIP